MTNGASEPSAADVADERSHLFTLAYRMLGSTAEAEDAVRQTYARWYGLTDAERATIGDPRPWLTAAAGRLCLAALASSRPVREEYPGDWLPDPVPGAVDAGERAHAQDRLSLDESVTMGLMVTLESLSPAERVAFVLHDVFGMSFAEAGAVVGRTAPATRELAKTARRRIAECRAQAATSDQHAATVHELRLAAQSGEPNILEHVLDPNVVMLTDDGGSVRSAADPAPVQGSAAVARKICAVLDRDPTEITEREVNGLSGLVLRRQGKVTGVVSVNVEDKLVTDLWIVLNPDKLRHWNDPRD